MKHRVDNKNRRLQTGHQNIRFERNARKEKQTNKGHNCFFLCAPFRRRYASFAHFLHLLFRSYVRFCICTAPTARFVSADRRKNARARTISSARLLTRCAIGDGRAANVGKHENKKKRAKKCSPHCVDPSNSFGVQKDATATKSKKTESNRSLRQ